MNEYHREHEAEFLVIYFFISDFRPTNDDTVHPEYSIRLQGWPSDHDHRENINQDYDVIHNVPPQLGDDRENVSYKSSTKRIERFR